MAKVLKMRVACVCGVNWVEFPMGLVPSERPLCEVNSNCCKKVTVSVVERPFDPDSSDASSFRG